MCEVDRGSKAGESQRPGGQGQSSLDCQGREKGGGLGQAVQQEL